MDTASPGRDTVENEMPHDPPNQAGWMDGPHLAMLTQYP
jgi:hypothetical protein